MTPTHPYTCIRWTFHFLIYEEEGVVHAHCLDTDTVATGETGVEAVKNLQDAIELQIDDCRRKGGSFDDFFRPAPQEYWNHAREAFKTNYTEIVERVRPTPESEEALDWTARSLYTQKVEAS